MQFEPFLAGEQYKLYKWREAYFREHFPPEVFDISDEEYSMDVLPFQITKNWRDVVIRSCTRRVPIISKNFYGNFGSNPLYFGLSNQIMCYFNPDAFNFKESDFDEIHFRGLIRHSNFDLNHMLVALFSKTPQSLVYLALKVCAVNSLDLSDAPLTVQKKSRCFWPDPTIPPDHLNDEGIRKWNFFRRRRTQLAEQYSASGYKDPVNEDEDYVSDGDG